MADFRQDFPVWTLHQLTSSAGAPAEPRRRRRAGLVLPALYSEFETPAMPAILNELSRIRTIDRIVLVLNQASEEQYFDVLRRLDRLPIAVSLLWLESPAVLDLLETVAQHGWPALTPGKGRAVWLGMGALLAEGGVDVIAMHDCDIRTYSRTMAERLVSPLLDPGTRLEFVKGFYARYTDRLNGRVARLFMAPLLAACQERWPGSRLVRALAGLRYPLAGECALVSPLAESVELPAHWGLEVGLTAEALERCGEDRLAQVEIAGRYDHKHQDLCEADAQGGLHRMVREISATLLRRLAAEGTLRSLSSCDGLILRYRALAARFASAYEAECRFNHLDPCLAGEQQAVRTFTAALEEGWREARRRPAGEPVLPSWRLMWEMVPQCRELLAGAAGAGAVAVPA